MPIQNILVTGEKGFIGKNLSIALKNNDEFQVLSFTRDNNIEDLKNLVDQADFIVHLAGINRPDSDLEFQTGNVDFTESLIDIIVQSGKKPPIILSSSTQAELDNPYGQSKKKAEDLISKYAQQQNVVGLIYRLPNVFGKWCRPEYNSAVATFCHNLARELPIQVNNQDHQMSLVFVDDVVNTFVSAIQNIHSISAGSHFVKVNPVYDTSLGKIVDLLKSFAEMQSTLLIPNFSNSFTHKLYSTYLSYLPPERFAYNLLKRTDDRGSLAEFVKSPYFGQVFVSRTKSGITRGNHFHHLKTEKFLVLEGLAVIRFRKVEDDSVLEYKVSGEDYQVVDIPPGYTHSIENIGDGVLVTLFFASEIFDPINPDTYYIPVIQEG